MTKRNKANAGTDSVPQQEDSNKRRRQLLKASMAAPLVASLPTNKAMAQAVTSLNCVEKERNTTQTLVVNPPSPDSLIRVNRTEILFEALDNNEQAAFVDVDNNGTPQNGDALYRGNGNGDKLIFDDGSWFFQPAGSLVSNRVFFPISQTTRSYLVRYDAQMLDPDIFNIYPKNEPTIVNPIGVSLICVQSATGDINFTIPS